MRTIFIYLLLFSSNFIYSQTKDTVAHKYGLLFDYNYSIVNGVGIKYRQTSDLAYFFRGSISSESRIQIIAYTRSEKVEKINLYTGFLGLEYNIYTMQNISLFVTVAGGATLHTENMPFYENNNFLVPAGNRVSEKMVTYSAQTGLGAEYYISNNLTISGSQSITLDYTKDEYPGYSNVSAQTSTLTKINIVYAKITLSFYFY